MKIIINNKELQGALNIVMPAIALKSTIPINECVLIESEAGKLKFTGTNSNLTVQTVANGSVDKDIQTCINFQELRAISSKLGDIPVTIEDVDGKIIVTGDGGKWKAGKSEDAVNYSKGRPFEPLWSTPIEADVPYYMGGALTCTNPKGERPMWRDVWINIKDGKMDIAAANGFAMMVHTSSVEDNITFKGIVNPSFVKAVEKLQGWATMEASEKSIRIKTEQTQVTVVLSEDVIPSYEKAYHAEREYNVEVSKNDFLSAVGSSLVYQPIGIMPPVIQLAYAKDKISISLEQDETDKSFDKTIDAEHDLKVGEMSFIASALQTALSLFPSTTDKIKLHVEAHDKLIFLKSDEDPLTIGVNPLAIKNN